MDKGLTKLLAKKDALRDKRDKMWGKYKLFSNGRMVIFTLGIGLIISVILWLKHRKICQKIKAVNKKIKKLANN